eukprot:6492384-Amphidinium_carterae.5
MVPRKIALHYLQTWFIIDMVVVTQDWVFVALSAASDSDSDASPSWFALQEASQGVNNPLSLGEGVVEEALYSCSADNCLWPHDLGKDDVAIIDPVCAIAARCHLASNLLAPELPTFCDCRTPRSGTVRLVRTLRIIRTLRLVRLMKLRRILVLLNEVIDSEHV